MTIDERDGDGNLSTSNSLSLAKIDEEKEAVKYPEKSVPCAKNDAQAPVVMDWDGPDDADNPQTWSSSKKMYHVLVPAILGFVVSLGTSLYPPSVSAISHHFHTSNEVSLIGLTTFVLGLGFGPVLGSPASETLGRRPVYLITIPLFGLFTLGAGFARNVETVIICRFFAGLFGGPALAVGAGTNADLYPPAKRVFTTSLFTLGPFLATGVGPVIGSYVDSRKGWRWVEWTSIFFAVFGFLFSMFTQETYKKIILIKRAKARGIPLPISPTGLAFFKHIMTVVLFRPIHMLFTEPIVAGFAIYVSFNFAVLFGFLASIPLIFTTVYGFSHAQSGLPFISIAIGCLLSIPTMLLLDRIFYRKAVRKATASGKGSAVAPEHRLYGAMVGSVGLPVSLFWFAWTSQESVHWIVPIIGLIPFAWGNISVFISCVLYMIDTYMAANGASAMAANGLARYIAGAVFPLFTVQMYNGMGFQWASSLLGFVTVVLLPVPWVLFLFGEKIRRRSAYDIWKG
ncbi:Polyamine transporter [Lachnellula occidentalis]|uniref:Polyamine transporter n=1 Tax=Lachnellula occidentalis TaxID=215460 RepID=A0A8H8S0I6_9HELO|nr:Polyamine transporter [Lachnellula occidentalis]